jgi:hypothetical protein
VFVCSYVERVKTKNITTTKRTDAVGKYFSRLGKISWEKRKAAILSGATIKINTQKGPLND